jgi:hypothetical protein
MAKRQARAPWRMKYRFRPSSDGTHCVAKMKKDYDIWITCGQPAEHDPYGRTEVEVRQTVIQRSRRQRRITRQPQTSLMPRKQRRQVEKVARGFNHLRGDHRRVKTTLRPAKRGRRDELIRNNTAGQHGTAQLRSDLTLGPTTFDRVWSRRQFGGDC